MWHLSRDWPAWKRQVLKRLEAGAFDCRVYDETAVAAIASETDAAEEVLAAIGRGLGVGRVAIASPDKPPEGLLDGAHASMWSNNAGSTSFPPSEAWIRRVIGQRALFSYTSRDSRERTGVVVVAPESTDVLALLSVDVVETYAGADVERVWSQL
jgi:hypothetical protein